MVVYAKTELGATKRRNNQNRVSEKLQNIKSMSLTHFLNYGKEGMAGIFRVELENPVANLNDLLSDWITEVQILEREKDGKYMVFIKSKPLKISFLPNFTIAEDTCFPHLKFKKKK